MCCPHCVQICLHGEGQQRIHRDRRKFILLHAIYFSLCSPEGLKKVRNPDRMYRTAVCYAGHGPPKSISDDTEMNSKSYSYLHRSYKRPLAGHCVMTSSVYPLTFSFHPPIHKTSYLPHTHPIPCSPPSPPPLHPLPPGAPRAGVRAVDSSVCFTGSCPQSCSVVVN